MAKRYNPIFFMEKNHRGAWVVYGDIGIKQYYYYTKTEAARLYREEAWAKQGQFVEETTMEWKTVRQCTYKGYTITDTGSGFWIHRPNGVSMGETCNVDDAMKWIDEDIQA